MALEIVKPGLSTTVQDLGRPGHQWLGIPVGGALDPVSLRAANALVGNPPGMGALEVLYLGPTLAVETESIRMSFAGADPIIEALAGADAAHGTLVETRRSIRLQRGAVIRIGRLARSIDQRYTIALERPGRSCTASFHVSVCRGCNYDATLHRYFNRCGKPTRMSVPRD